MGGFVLFCSDDPTHKYCTAKVGWQRLLLMDEAR